MAFKYLSLSTTNKTLPEPAFIHNPTGSPITLTVTMANELFSTLKSGANLLDRVKTLPTLVAAQSSTPYDTTSDGRGSGGKLNITTSNVGSDLGTFLEGATGAIFGGTLDYDGDLTTYEPTATGSGTGFKVRFQVRGSALAQTVEGLEVIDAGTGYAAADVLTFTNPDTTTFTRTLAASDITDVFQPSAITVKSGDLGDNYKVSDTLYVTLAQTVSTVEYEFPLELQLQAADLASTTITYVLASGETTPFQAVTLKAGASTNILAIS